MDFSSLLNERQLDAVTTPSQNVRIVAGAGSGKTRVLTYRIAYLISEMHVNPRHILAIAFTNKVAKEMKERALKLVPEAGNSLQISTFHSFCARFIRQEASAIGFPSDFTIYDDEDQEKLVKSICEELGYSKKDEIVKQSLIFIADSKCKGYYPGDITLKPNEAYLKEHLKIFDLYETRKSQMYGLDFDDLLLQTINILENCDDIREKWRRKIDHILVDEFQDTNDVQMHLVKLLAKPSCCLYVVGDPDQTIYTWRGANQEIILQFEKNFSHVETIILDRNYRSTQNILDAANKLIANNKKRIPKDLYTNNQEGDSIILEEFDRKESEATFIAKQIKDFVKKEGAQYQDIAVLYRSSYLTLPLEKELASLAIPYRIFGGLRFFQRKEIKDVLAYVKLIFNPLDDLSFERIVNVPKRGIGQTSFEQLRIEKNNARVSYYNYVLHIEEYETELSRKVINQLVSFVDIIERYKKKFDENLEIYSILCEQMMEELGYIDYLAEMDDGQDRIENVKSLYGDMYTYIKSNPESTFQEYLNNVTLATSQDDMNGGDYVSLMTVHTAKGLEFPYVFVMGLSETVFPNGRASLERGHDGMEEERRLCYVAFTRAEKKLILTRNNDYSFIAQSKLMVSRFVREAGLRFKTSRDYSPWGQGKMKSFNFDDFDDSKKVEIPVRKPQITDNGISSWEVGDIAVHTKFGEGVVTKVIDDGSIIEVDFENEGKKTLLAKHPMISKKEKVGGVA